MGPLTIVKPLNFGYTSLHLGPGEVAIAVVDRLEFAAVNGNESVGKQVEVTTTEFSHTLGQLQSLHKKCIRPPYLGICPSCQLLSEPLPPWTSEIRSAQPDGLPAGRRKHRVLHGLHHRETR